MVCQRQEEKLGTRVYALSCLKQICVMDLLTPIIDFQYQWATSLWGNPMTLASSQMPERGSARYYHGTESSPNLTKTSWNNVNPNGGEKFSIPYEYEMSRGAQHDHLREETNLLGLCSKPRARDNESWPTVWGQPHPQRMPRSPSSTFSSCEATDRGLKEYWLSFMSAYLKNSPTGAHGAQDPNATLAAKRSETLWV